MKSETSQTEEKTREKDGEAAGRVSPHVFVVEQKPVQVLPRHPPAGTASSVQPVPTKTN